MAKDNHGQDGGGDVDHGEDFADFRWTVDDMQESEFAKEWLHWCRAQPNVKCVDTDVPPGILPQNYAGILIDVKVGGKGRMPDDKLYVSNPELRDKVARGNTVLELRHKRTKEVHYVFLIFAMKKFSGGMGDEDDCPSAQNEWQTYFLKGRDEAVKVVCTNKANGEAGHASVRQMGGQTYFCLGSKNVHMLVKSQYDIPKYKEGGRYQVAEVVAETFFRQYFDDPATYLHPKNLGDLCDFLHREKAVAVFEVLQPSYQHVENLSYLDQPQLVFICWTSYKLMSNSDSLCIKSPNVAIEIARAFGMKTVDYEIIDVSNADDYMTNIRKAFGYEGKVLNFLDAHDNDIGMIKKKTAWYIILRAIREKVCFFIQPNCKLTAQEKTAKISKRITEIQAWIGFSDDYKKSWTALGTTFLKWLLTKTEHKESFAVRAQFPILWDQFLDAHEDMREIYNRLETNYD